VYTFQEALLCIILAGEKVKNDKDMSISDQLGQLSLGAAPHTSSKSLQCTRFKLHPIHYAGLSLLASILRSPLRPLGLSASLNHIQNQGELCHGPNVQPCVSLPITITASVKMEELHVPATAGQNTRFPTPMTQTPPIQRYPASGPISLAQTHVVYKYIRNKAGIVGTITNPAGVTSNITEEVINAIGSSRAEYLDAHGFGSDETASITRAFCKATSIREFTALAAGYGMAYTELEWFWSLS